MHGNNFLGILFPCSPCFRGITERIRGTINEITFFSAAVSAAVVVVFSAADSFAVDYPGSPGCQVCLADCLVASVEVFVAVAVADFVVAFFSYLFSQGSAN